RSRRPAPGPPRRRARAARADREHRTCAARLADRDRGRPVTESEAVRTTAFDPSPRRRPLLRRIIALPAGLLIGIVYVLSRLVTLGFFALAAEISGPASRHGADATIGSLALGWDAQWY